MFTTIDSNFVPEQLKSMKKESASLWNDFQNKAKNFSKNIVDKFHRDQ